MTNCQDAEELEQLFLGLSTRPDQIKNPDELGKLILAIFDAIVEGLRIDKADIESIAAEQNGHSSRVPVPERVRCMLVVVMAVARNPAKYVEQDKADEIGPTFEAALQAAQQGLGAVRGGGQTGLGHEPAGLGHELAGLCSESAGHFMAWQIPGRGTNII